MSIKSSSSSTSVELKNLLDLRQERGRGTLRSRTIAHLERMDCAIRIFASLSLILLVATVVFLGLAQAQYVHPLLALYSLGGCVASFIVVKGIDCCQRFVAEKHGPNFLDSYYKMKQPPPPAKQKGKK